MRKPAFIFVAYAALLLACAVGWKFLVKDDDGTVLGVLPMILMIIAAAMSTAINRIRVIGVNGFVLGLVIALGFGLNYVRLAWKWYDPESMFAAQPLLAGVAGLGGILTILWTAFAARASSEQILVNVGGSEAGKADTLIPLANPGAVAIRRSLCAFGAALLVTGYMLTSSSKLPAEAMAHIQQSAQRLTDDQSPQSRQVNAPRPVSVESNQQRPVRAPVSTPRSSQRTNSLRSTKQTEQSDTDDHRKTQGQQPSGSDGLMSASDDVVESSPSTQPDEPPVSDSDETLAFAEDPQITRMVDEILLALQDGPMLVSVTSVDADPSLPMIVKPELGSFAAKNDIANRMTKQQIAAADRLNQPPASRIPAGKVKAETIGEKWTPDPSKRRMPNAKSMDKQAIQQALSERPELAQEIKAAMQSGSVDIPADLDPSALQAIEQMGLTGALDQLQSMDSLDAEGARDLIETARSELGNGDSDLAEALENVSAEQVDELISTAETVLDGLEDIDDDQAAEILEEAIAAVQDGIESGEAPSQALRKVRSGTAEKIVQRMEEKADRASGMMNLAGITCMALGLLLVAGGLAAKH